MPLPSSLVDEGGVHLLGLEAFPEKEEERDQVALVASSAQSGEEAMMRLGATRSEGTRKAEMAAASRG